MPEAASPPVPSTPVDVDRLAAPDDPYAVFEEIRAAGPVVRSPSGFWFVTGYDAANAVLRDPRLRSGPIADGYRAALPPGAARDEMAYRINFLDPPDHGRVRGLVQAAFSARRLGDLRPWVEAKAAALAAELSARLTDGPVDLIDAYCHPLPSLVISELLGVPDAERDQLTAWTEAVTPLLGIRLDPAEKAAALEASEAFAAFARDLLAARRAAPGDDLLSDVAAASVDPETGVPARLLEPELLSLVVTLYSAGHRTTRDLVGNGILALLEQPGAWARLSADPGAVPDVVREFLRYDTPTLYVARIPAEPVPVAGATVGPGEPVLVLLGAANHDPEVFAAPDRFLPGQEGPAPLSFAAGPHHCLGAHLARMEAEVMLSTLLAALPTLELAPGAAIERRHRGPFRGLAALPAVAG